VPALKTVGSSLTVAQLMHIINHGLGEPEAALHARLGRGDLDGAGRQPRCLPPGRPAAVRSTHPVSVPAGQGAAVAGAALYVRYGCINCHGPNGLGGVANPLSQDKVIPPLSGQGFRHDFPTDKAIADVIRSGSVIGKAPIVSMPHWGGILSDQQIAELIAYLKTLK
jgi:mono/diheme cytochrome c family protein